MTTLTLDRVWVNLVATGEAVAAISRGRARAHGMDGEVRTYGGGRQRAIATEGIKGEFAVTIRGLSLSTVELLQSWIGQAVQIRDHRGQRFFGTFFSVTPGEWDPQFLYDAAIVLGVLTHPEGV